MALNLKKINYQDPLRSKPQRQNYTDIQNYINDLQYQVDNIATVGTLSEVVNARDYADSLRDRLRQASKPINNTVISGLEVLENLTPNMKIQASSGYGLADGVLCYLSSTVSSGTITAPTDERYDVVVLNSDNTLSVEAGNDSTDPILPVIAETQRPLAILNLDSSTTALNNGTEIIDASQQGCYVDGVWYWKIQDAVNSLDNRTNIVEQGNIKVNKGSYYEEIDLSGKNNIAIDFDNGANLYRASDSNYCIKSINSISNETEKIKINNGSLYGNGKAGSNELLKFTYTDKFVLSNMFYDDNASSTATYNNYVIDNCDEMYIENETLTDYTTSTSITDSTKINKNDGVYMLAGSNLFAYADTESTITNVNTPTKVKEIQIGRRGEITIKFDFKMNSGGPNAYAQIYKNGVALGTLRDVTTIGSYVTYSEDLDYWEYGDLCQLYVWNLNLITESQYRNFKLYTRTPTNTMTLLDN